jgi:hypothetical protein
VVEGVEAIKQERPLNPGGSGVSGTGGAGLGAGKMGVGAKATACYYQLINTISSDTECCE